MSIIIIKTFRMNKKVCVLICIIIIALLFVIVTNSRYYEQFDTSECYTTPNCKFVENKEYKSCKVPDGNIQRYQICRTDYTPPIPPVPPVPPKVKCVHGKIVSNKCVCASGWKGSQCDIPVPPHDPFYGIQCGDHGSCKNGKCICTDGWTGFNCQIKPEDPCTNVNCGAHGSCKTGKCICTDGWTGDKCQIKPYDPCDGINCGAHGACTNGQCNCTDGWTGDKCDVPPGGGGKPKAVIVIRHGQKGPKGDDGDNNPSLSYLDKPYYFKDAETNPLTGQHVHIGYADLSKTGYDEGKLFATTVPSLADKYAPITRAAILTPADGSNGNTYLTSYPLLKKLSQEGTLKKLDFYRHASDIENLTPKGDDGSVLIAGDAGSLWKEHPSILSILNGQYNGNAKHLDRGQTILIYADDPKKLTQYRQNPSTGSVALQ